MYDKEGNDAGNFRMHMDIVKGVLGKRSFCQNLKRLFISGITGQNVQRWQK